MLVYINSFCIDVVSVYVDCQGGTASQFIQSVFIDITCDKLERSVPELTQSNEWYHNLILNLIQVLPDCIFDLKSGLVLRIQHIQVIICRMNIFIDNCLKLYALCALTPRDIIFLSI